MADETTTNPQAGADWATTISGEIIRPGEPGYKEARQAWNLTIQQQPAVIVQAANAADVSAAVRHAVAEGLGVAVQTTGHGVSRSADGALLIRTAGLDALHVDAGAQTAWVGAGLQWGPVLAAAQEVGLAPLLGSSPTVGAVGYTLGGGMGWLGRKYGLACDSVNAFEVVLANGRTVRASAKENEELFWGLRGSAGSLGVITGMEIQLYPVQMVYGGNLMYPMERARAVLTRYRDWIETLPDEMTSAVALINVPPLPDIPEMLQGKSFAVVRGCYCGALEDGKALIDSWRAWQAPAIDMFQEMPFAAVAAISMDPEGPVPGAGTSAWVKALSDEAIDVLIDHTAPRGGPPPLVYSEVRHAGGAVNVVDAAANAYSHRNEQFLLHVIGITPSPEAYRHVTAHIDNYQEALAPHLSGTVYINFLEGEEKWAHTAEAFPADKLRRLQQLKATYDPDNLFRYGLDIQPAA